MKMAVFDTHRFDQKYFSDLNAKYNFELKFFESRLAPETASLAKGFPAICVFVNDRLNKETLEILKEGGTKLIALRSAGFNHVDLNAAEFLGLKVVRVPEYSPYAVAEFAVTLLLALNRKIHRAYNRTHDLNFSLDGLLGFDLHGKTVGIIGVGKIGAVFSKIMNGFGCKLLAFDLNPNLELTKTLDLKYTSLEEIYRQSDIISLHVPLNPKTLHLFDATVFALMKKGVILINTGRGGLIDSKALIQALKSGKVGAAGLDVYEEEEKIFFQDLSGQVLNDDVLARLLTFPNVLITSHQGFFTEEAITKIVTTTFENVSAFEKGIKLENEVCLASTIQ